MTWKGSWCLDVTTIGVSGKKTKTKREKEERKEHQKLYKVELHYDSWRPYSVVKDFDKEEQPVKLLTKTVRKGWRGLCPKSVPTLETGERVYKYDEEDLLSN